MLTGSKLDRREMPAQLSLVSPCSKLKAIICRRLPGRHPANRWRRSLAGTKRWQIRTKKRARTVKPAPEEKNGARAVACPGCGFSRLEREADSQAELPLVELGARDLQEVPAFGASVVKGRIRIDHNAAIAIGVVEMW